MGAFAPFARKTGVVPFNVGTGALVSPYFHQGFNVAPDGSIYAAQGGVADHYHNGLPFDANGRLILGAGATARVSQNVPYTSSNEVNVGGGIPSNSTYYSQGVGFTSVGAMNSEDTGAPVTVAPVVVVQPVAQNVVVGQTLTFTAAATGAASQQWYKDTVLIVGATSTTYAKANAQLSDDGDYFCRFTNIIGSTDTNTVTGTVTAGAVAPVIDTQPTNQSINVGATLTLVAASSNAVSQQWYFGGVAISGATSATYSKANAQVGDTGSYFCRFTNGTGSTDTNTVTGTVTVAPTGSTLTFNGTTQYGTI